MGKMLVAVFDSEAERTVVGTGAWPRAQASATTVALTPITTLQAPPGYHVYFASLRDKEEAMLFPCDMAGEVDIDGLSPPARNNNLFARAMMGREFAYPIVLAETPRDLTNGPGRENAMDRQRALVIFTAVAAATAAAWLTFAGMNEPLRQFELGVIGVGATIPPELTRMR